MSHTYRFDSIGDSRSTQECNALQMMASNFEASPFSTLEKILNFPLYVPRQNLTTFLVKYEIMKRILNVHGSIIECGVGFGGGLMTWAQLSAILEPTNHQRRVIGFDTFSGFPSVRPDDHASVGDLAVDSAEEIQKCAVHYDLNRSVGHIPKLELVRGDITQMVPDYIERNPHLVVSLLYIDCDIYQPTYAALHHLRTRMPVGSIIAFDELNLSAWPGETQALHAALGIEMLKLERCAFGSTISWAVL